MRLMRSCALILSLCLVAVSAAQEAPIFPIYESGEATGVFAPAGTAFVDGLAQTRMVLDDITPQPGFAGQTVYAFGFRLRNNGTEILSFVPQVCAWKADGSSVGPSGVPNPGYYLTNPPEPVGYKWNTTTLAPSGIVELIARPEPSKPFKVPSGSFWFGLGFADSPEASFGAALDQLQLVTANSVVGASSNALFQTAAAGMPFNLSNPAGSQFQLGGASSNLACLIGVQGQDFIGTVQLQAVDSPVVARTLTYEVWSGGSVLASGEWTFSNGSAPVGQITLVQPTVDAPDPVFASVVGPAVLPAGASDLKLVVYGASFLASVATLNLPNPPHPGTASPAQSFGVITLRNGDVDQNGEVDLTDIDLIIGDYLTEGGTIEGEITDLDANGEVDLTDIDIAIGNYLEADELP